VPGQQAALKLSKYNFEEKNFKINHCLFSDKLQYTKGEQRIVQNLKGADQERCYFRTSNTELKIGFVGGSNVRLKVEDPELARKIAAEKDSLRIEVFGYVDSVQRDKVGGTLVKERRNLGDRDVYSVVIRDLCNDWDALIVTGYSGLGRRRHRPLLGGHPGRCRHPGRRA